MKIFHLPRSNRKLHDEETPLQRLFRVLVILLLFGGVVFGFWLNNERRMERMEMLKSQSVHSSQRDGNPACGVPFT